MATPLDTPNKVADKPGDATKVSDLTRAENLSRQVNALPPAEKRQQESPSAAELNLPGLKIVDSSKVKAAEVTVIKPESAESKNKITEIRNADGSRSVQIESDNRTAQIRFDESGKAVSYIDFEGQKFNNKGDKWTSRTNLVQPEGMNVEIDGSYNVRMKDNATGIVRTNRADGIQEVSYPDGGKTTSKTRGNTEWITIESVNRVPRSLQLVDGKPVYYTDGAGNTYTKRETDAKAATFTFDKTNLNGEQQKGTYTVSADRSGNVVVRDLEKKGQSDYAKRELNNGTIITSDDKGIKRSVTTAEGLRIDTTFGESKVPKEKTITYPNGAGKLHVHYDKAGNVDQAEGKVNGERVNYRVTSDLTLIPSKTEKLVKEISEEHGQIKITKHYPSVSSVIDVNGMTVASVKDVIAPKNPEASPLIQETPKDIDVSKNIAEAKKHADENMWKKGKWFADKVDYGHEWDFKTKGAQYEAFGNFHYGVVGKAAGISETNLRQQAGIAQEGAGTSQKGWGDSGYGIGKLKFFGSGNYGDDPTDQHWIKKGIHYYAKQEAKDERIRSVASAANISTWSGSRLADNHR